MSQSEPQFIEVTGADGSGRRIAYLLDRPATTSGPGVVWLSGYTSDMVGQKADTLASWSERHARPYTRFDYCGNGRSEGRFEDATIGDWIEDTFQVFTRLTDGPQILVGSSMGGWIALALVRRLQREDPAGAARIRGLVLIAPAVDMTEKLMWQAFPPDVRAAIEREGVWFHPASNGDDPYPITFRLIEEGRRHLFGSEPFDPGCPVEILHGQRDADVPWQQSLAQLDLLARDDVRLTLVKDGEHRLSRREDLALLVRAVAGIDGPPSE